MICLGGKIVIGNVSLGEAPVKIIATVAAKSGEDILGFSQSAINSGADIIEWRADYYAGVVDATAMRETLLSLRRVIGDTPLIFTYRTDGEGGLGKAERCAGVAKNALGTGVPDIVDIEVFNTQAAALIPAIKKAGVYVLGSYHNMAETPGGDELSRIFSGIESFGVDIAKIAVMPRSARDVLALILAAERFSEIPRIAVSMSRLGVISRVVGVEFGSCATYANAGELVIPGQLSVSDTVFIMGVLG